jgi:hypothetical protein
MTEVAASKKLPGSTKLWRYISLDKLVDLLSTSELFFTPLSTFAGVDPFEGYVPSVAFDAHASVFRKAVDNSEALHRQMIEHREKSGIPLTSPEREKIRALQDDLRSSPRRFYDAIMKAITVNYWHESETESEAMWRLYAESGKAVAIETTLDDLRESIQHGRSSCVVHIYPVKYLDFFDTTLQPSDCVVEGHLAPLLKRISYKHEREVRAFIAKVAPDVRASANLDFWKPEPMRIPVNVKVLVKTVHISPYA